MEKAILISSVLGIIIVFPVIFLLWRNGKYLRIHIDYLAKRLKQETADKDYYIHLSVRYANVADKLSQLLDGYDKRCSECDHKPTTRDSSRGIGEESRGKERKS